MDILVTGAAGFLGSSLCERLLRAGHTVWGVDNLLTGDLQNIEFLKKYPNFSFGQCGIETPQFLGFCSAAKVKFQRIYNLACPTGVPNIQVLGEEMLQASSTGTWQVLRLALDHGSELLFTSSSEIYGEALVSPQKESYEGNVDPTGPRANYEEGKRFSETLVAWFVRRYGLNAKIVRLFNAYGPRMSFSDMRVVPRFGWQALNNLPITLYGDGEQSRTLCYVEDILDGFEIIMEKGVPGQVYNLGSNQPIKIKDLVVLIVGLANSSSKITIIPRAAHDHSGRLPDLQKIQALGWKSKIDLKHGLKQTLEAFKYRIVEMGKTSAKPGFMAGQEVAEQNV